MRTLPEMACAARKKRAHRHAALRARCGWQLGQRPSDPRGRLGARLDGRGLCPGRQYRCQQHADRTLGRLRRGSGIVTASGDAQGLEVTGSKITGFATGIYINPGSDATVTGNVLEANNVGLSNDGPDAVNISGNSFVNNVVEQIGIGAANAGANNVGAIVGANSFTGSAPEVSIYDANGTGQTITGTQHDDVIHLGGGGDVIDAGDGDDHIIWTVGDGSDIVDGGVVTNTDTFEAVGTGAAGEEFLIETVAAYETRTSTSGTLDAGTEIVVSRSTDSGATFTAISELRNIDDIFINGSSGGPVGPGFGVTISGDFSATDLDSSTITIVGTSGNDTINVADFTDGDDSDGLQHIVFVSNGGEDTITGARPEDLVGRHRGARSSATRISAAAATR
jgi:hypothetical protein